MSYDKEIKAMHHIYGILKGLDNGEIQRILSWLKARYGLTKRPSRPGAAAVKNQAPQPAGSPVITDFNNYGTFEELFSAANVKTTADKILLASAYLHEKRNLTEFVSEDINGLLKETGTVFSNISMAINSLLYKNPPLLVITGKLGPSKQARRTYSITETGLSRARRYINHRQKNRNRNRETGDGS